jgi:hypothetical protein
MNVMTFRTLLIPAAAAIALAVTPALAQHMGGMGGGSMHTPAASTQAGIAEGTVKNGVRVVEMQVT